MNPIFFASYIESKWIEKLHLMANDPGLQKFFMLSEKDFSDFASELSTGAARLGLQEKMAEAFRKVAAYANTKEGEHRPQTGCDCCANT